MVETSPQTPEAEAFLETIKQYPDEDVGTASANEESAAGSAESGSGSVGAAESGEGEGRGEEAGAMAADDVEKDHPKAPKKKEEVSGKVLIHAHATLMIIPTSGSQTGGPPKIVQVTIIDLQVNPL